MAYPIHGKVAAIAKNSVEVGSRIGYTLNVALKLDDATPQGANWDLFLAGTAGATGQMDCMFAPDNAPQKALMDNIINATPGTLLTDVVFQLEDSGDYLSGDIFITGFALAANKGGKVTCNFPFTVNDALTLTIAA